MKTLENRLLSGRVVFCCLMFLLCACSSTCRGQQTGGTEDTGEVTQGTYIVVSDNGTEIYGYVDSFPDSYMVGDNAVLGTIADAQMSVNGTPRSEVTSPDGYAVLQPTPVNNGSVYTLIGTTYLCIGPPPPPEGGGGGGPPDGCSPDDPICICEVYGICSVPTQPAEAGGASANFTRNQCSDPEGDPGYLMGFVPITVTLQTGLPNIVSLSVSSDLQGGTGPLTITGSNLVDDFGLSTINYSSPDMSGPAQNHNAQNKTSQNASYTIAANATAGLYNISVSTTFGTSNKLPFTIVAPSAPPPPPPPPDPCAVTSNPQAGYTSIVSTGAAAGSGTMSVSFSGAAFAAISQTVNYGPYSTPSSIASNIAALITYNYLRRGLTAKAFGPNIIYSGDSTIGTVSTLAIGTSISTDSSSGAAAAAESACDAGPPPPPCPTGITVANVVTKALPDFDHPSWLTGVGILTLMTVTGPASDYTGAILTETVAPVSNSCPANIQAYTSFPPINAAAHSDFFVGATAEWEGQAHASAANSFYDSHKLILNVDILGLTNVGSCKATAKQTYTCNGQPIGTFTLTNNYSHGTLSGQSVTNVSVTKQ